MAEQWFLNNTPGGVARNHGDTKKLQYGIRGGFLEEEEYAPRPGKSVRCSWREIKLGKLVSCCCKTNYLELNFISFKEQRFIYLKGRIRRKQREIYSIYCFHFPTLSKWL